MMSQFYSGFRNFGGCCSCVSSPQGVIIFSALIALLFIEILDQETLENAGNVIETVGQMMTTAAGFC